MSTPDISEGAFAVARALFPELCTGLSDDTSDFYAKAAAIQAALDSAHPAPMEGGETPETDAEFSAHPIYYKSSAGNHFPVLQMVFARSLERRLAEKTREVEVLKDKLTAQVLFSALGSRLLKRVFEAADMSLPDATDAELSLVRIISERDSLRAQLQKANELLGEAHRCYFDPGHMEPNTWGTKVSHKLDDYFRTHLNHQTK